MNAKSILLSILFLTGLATLPQAQPIYLEFANDCMEEMEFQVTGSKARVETAFRLPMEKGESLILNAGKTEETFREPRNTRSCDKLEISSDVARMINSGRGEVYIVKKIRSNKYMIYTISDAAVVISDKDYVEYYSKEMAFSYRYEPTSKKKDLSNRQSQAKVYYERITSSKCPKKVAFKQTLTFKQNGVNRTRQTNFTLSDHFGVVHSESPEPLPYSGKEVKQLRKINGKAAQKYMEDFCDGDSDIVSNRPIPDAADSPDPQLLSKATKDRIAFDGISGLYIDKYSWTPANIRVDETVYLDGKQHLAKDLPPKSFPGVLPRIGYTNPTKCKVYLDMESGKYINLFTGNAFNGICNGIIYDKGARIGLTDEKDSPSNECFLVVDEKGYYLNPGTGLPFTGNCNGYEYRNGIIVGTGSGQRFEEGISPADLGDCGKVSTTEMHIVQAGETLNSIARRYGLSVGQLKQWNNLATDFIRPCTELKIQPPREYLQPSSNPSYNTSPSTSSLYARGQGNYYTVQVGDNVYSIARKFGYTEDRLRRMNGLSNWENVRPGQQLMVSEASGPSGYDASGKKVSPGPTSYDNELDRLIFKDRLEEDKPARPDPYADEEAQEYEVKKGDTLWKIAQKYGTTVKELKEMNNLRSDRIYPRQKLKYRK
jgi:LysM repeat protein